MKEKTELVKVAREAFVSGLNCAQSTALPFADIAGCDKEMLLNALSAFGGGVAGLKETCGVVTGIAFVVGLTTSGKLDKAEQKEEVQRLIAKFSDKFETTTCGKLVEDLDKKPVASAFTGKVYPEKKCVPLVETGVDVLYDYFS